MGWKTKNRGKLNLNNNSTVSNSHYNIDQVTINGQHLVTVGGIYDAQYQDWIAHGRTLAIADYAAMLPLNGGYYTISSSQGLKDALGFTDVGSYRFRLSANLDLSAAPGLFIPYFSADVFDGAGHVVSNLVVNQPNVSSVGFIGSLVSGSTLTNLGLTGNSITGYSAVGGLVGANKGTVSNSYATGTVSASAGGGSIGGVVGLNYGIVSNSFATGTVSGGRYDVGGLVGFNVGGTISNSYAASVVSMDRPREIGGLVGNNVNGGTVTNSFWDTQVSQQPTSAGGTGLTSAQMKMGANFTSASAANGNVNPNWEFTNTWRIVEGQTYPGLRALVQSLTVAANATTTYSGTGWAGANAMFSYSIPGTASLVFGTPTYGGSAAGAVNTGSYTVTTGNLASAQFDLSYADGALTINKAHLIVSADNQSRLYGAANPTLTGAISGFVNGETLATSGVTGSAAFSIAATSGTAVGTAPIAAAQGTLAAGNYDFTTFTPGTLTIDRAPLTVTANAASKTYDGQAYAGGNGVGYSGFVNNETAAVLGGTLAYGGNAQGATNAGTYTITPSGLTSGNYTLTFANGTLTVSKAPLTVTANSENKYFDGLAYSGGDGAAYSGFVHGETSSVLGGTLVYGGDAQGAIRPGSYAITVSGLTSGNYALSFVDGVLKIAQIMDDKQPSGGLLARVADEERRRGGQPALLTSAAPANAYALPFVDMSPGFVMLPSGK